MHQDRFEEEKEFSFKSLLFPLTSLKAIYWIIFIGLIVYANMLFNGFVWDDKTYMINNPETHTINFINAFKENLFNIAGQYRPISAFYFSIVYALFGNSTFGYHLIQMVLHIAVAVLVFVLYKKFFSNKIAFFLSLIFLIHPIQVESVSYISASDSELFMIFGFLAFFLGISERIDFKKILIYCICIFLSLLTKETGILFLFLIFFYEVFFQKKLNKILIYSGIGVFLIYLFIRFAVGGVGLETRVLTPIARLSLSERLINIPAIIFHYLSLFFFPRYLSIDQQWIITNTSFNSFYLPLGIDLLFIIALIWVGFAIYKTKKSFESIKIYLFFSMWFVIGMLILLQIFPLDGTVADRWFYFPIVGLLGILGVIIQWFLNNKANLKIVTLAAIIILLLLSTRTIIRNSNWIDAISLYTHDSKIYDNYDIENNLAYEYGVIQDYREALPHNIKSVEFSPNETSLCNLGITYLKLGNIQKAKQYCYQALAGQSYQSDKQIHEWYTYDRLSLILLTSNSAIEAKNISLRGLHEYPNAGNLWLDLAIADYKLDNQKDALLAADKARVYSPGAQSDYIYLRILNKQTINVSP